MAMKRDVFRTAFQTVDICLACRLFLVYSPFGWFGDVLQVLFLLFVSPFLWFFSVLMFFVTCYY